MMDNTERILSFIDSIDTNSKMKTTQPLPEPLPPPSETIPKEAAPSENQAIDSNPFLEHSDTDIYNIDNIHENERLYKGFRSRLNKIKHYPQSVKVFGNNYITVNSSEDIEQLKAKITQNRRTFNKNTKSKQLRDTKMNIKELPVLEEDDMTYREDEYIYKRNQPIGVLDDENKPRRIPKTNQRDRMTIFEDLATNKDHLRDLVNNRDDFEMKTEEYLSNDNRAMYNQHRHNNLVADNTWTYETFIKIIDDIGRANEQREQQLKAIKEQNDPYYKYAQNGKAFSAYGLNPNLLKRK